MFRTALAVGTLLASFAAAAEPIPGVTAKATSFQVAKLFGPENLTTDTGLTEGKLATNGYTGGGCMWHSGYIALGGDENAIVEFDLAKVRTVGRFHLWNYNSDPSRGFKHVSVFISDDGKKWAPVAQRFEFAKAPKREDYLGEDYAFAPPIRARFIRFHCDATHRVGGNRELSGLGKVRFYESDAKIEPGPSLGAGVVPDGAGLINVKLPPYSARGDGIADDTAAVQKAIDDWQGSHRTLLLPAGTYLVSKTLAYAPGKGHGYNNILGAGRDRTIIRLKDGTFSDAAKPQPVLTLGFNGRPDGKGTHADWFNNNVARFTIDTGRGNPGAIGLQYYSNNAGALRDVSLHSPDAKGAIGLDLGYADQNGPCLATNIDIDGFALGVRSGATVNSQTAEHIRISKVKTGWENNGQCVSIRGLKAEASEAGFVNKYGVVALIDSSFTGSGEAAIATGETLFARNVKTTGFKLAIRNTRKNDGPTADAPGPDVDEWVSTKPLTLFPVEKPRSLNLPIEEVPSAPEDAPATWMNVRAFRELADPDDTASFQRALDSGATTLYFPSGGSFIFSRPVELRGKVRRIVGFHSHVRGVKDSATWTMGDAGSPLVSVEGFSGHIHIEQASGRTLVVKDGMGVGGKLTGAGKVFLENVVAEWDFAAGSAWARQYNNERAGTHFTNSGAKLWILGLKTERGGTLIDTRGKGAATELIGGLSYTTNRGKLAPMFTVTDARLSATIGEVCYTGDPFATLVKQIRGEEVKALDRKGIPLRPSFLQGGQLPLFVAEP